MLRQRFKYQTYIDKVHHFSKKGWTFGFFSNQYKKGNTIILFDTIQFVANQLFIKTLLQPLQLSHVHKQLDCSFWSIPEMFDPDISFIRHKIISAIGSLI